MKLQRKDVLREIYQIHINHLGCYKWLIEQLEAMNTYARKQRLWPLRRSAIHFCTSAKWCRCCDRVRGRMALWLTSVKRAVLPRVTNRRARCHVQYLCGYSYRCSLPWRRTPLVTTTTRHRRWSTSVCCSRSKVRSASRGLDRRRRWPSVMLSAAATSTKQTSGRTT